MSKNQVKFQSVKGIDLRLNNPSNSPSSDKYIPHPKHILTPIPEIYIELLKSINPYPQKLTANYRNLTTNHTRIRTQPDPP